MLLISPATRGRRVIKLDDGNAEKEKAGMEKINGGAGGATSNGSGKLWDYHSKFYRYIFEISLYAPLTPETALVCCKNAAKKTKLNLYADASFLLPPNHPPPPLLPPCPDFSLEDRL